MGTLYIVSTPIGNLEDITVRAIKTLFSVETIACEDSRRTGLLLQEIKKRYSSILAEIDTKEHKLVSLYDEVEMQKTPEIIALLSLGDVALVSDAGTPLINDPGYILVREALKRGIRVRSVPGPSAVVAALSISGLPTNSFMYLGYPPEKQAQRIKLLANIQLVNEAIASTYVLYSAPHKLEGLLTDMNTIFPQANITIVRELTKIHEQIYQGTIEDALLRVDEFKGEIVVLFHLPK
jgi:16S rRNA (cytidine1402-2'-O)-methyltransferase